MKPEKRTTDTLNTFIDTDEVRMLAEKLISRTKQDGSYVHNTRAERKICDLIDLYVQAKKTNERNSCDALMNGGMTMHCAMSACRTALIANMLIEVAYLVEDLNREAVEACKARGEEPKKTEEARRNDRVCAVLGNIVDVLTNKRLSDKASRKRALNLVDAFLKDETEK